MTFSFLKLKIPLSVLLLCIIILTLSACGSGVKSTGSETKSYSISTTKSQINPKETQQLSIQDTESTEIISGLVSSWVSQFPEVASVDENGVVTALSPGVTTITAMIDGKEITIKFTILGDFFAFTSENGDARNVGDKLLTENNSIFASYSAAYVDYLTVYDDDNEDEDYYYDERNRKDNEPPPSKLVLKLSNNFDKFTGEYNEVIELSTPSTEIKTYYTSDRIIIDVKERDDEDRRYRNRYDYYLDYITLDTVGEVGELVEGTAAYWRCNDTCNLQVVEFHTTRENDKRFITQGTKESPLLLGQGKFVYAEELTTVKNEPSYYKVGVTSGIDYNFDANWFYNSGGISIYSDSSFSKLLCTQTWGSCSAKPDSDFLYIRIESRRNEFVGLLLNLTIAQLSPQEDITQPILLSADIPFLRYEGFVANGNTGYYKINVKPSTPYTVALHRYKNIYGNFTLNGYSDTDFLIATFCRNNLYAGNKCNFTTAAEQNVLYLKLNSSDNTPFLLSIIPREFKALGSIDSPIDIQNDLRTDREQDNASYIAETDVNNSYFTVESIPNQLTRIDLIQLRDNVDLYVYSDDAFVDLLCSSINADTTDESCEFTTIDEQNQLYFKVSGENATTLNGSDFLIRANPLYFVQGTLEAPILIETGLNTQLSTSTGFDADSFYMIKIPANTAISFSLDVLETPNEDYVNAQVYTDAGFSSRECRFSGYYVSDYYKGEGNNDNACYYYSGDVEETIYIQIDSSDQETGSGFVLNIKQRLFESLGSISEPYVVANIAPFNFSRQSASNTPSFLQLFTGSGKQYQIDMTPSNDDLDMEVYSDSSYSSLLCSNAVTGLGVESCVFTASENGFTFIKINGENATLYQGSEFNIQVVPLFDSVGDTTTPASLGAAPITDTSSTVGSMISSFYQIDVEIDKTYLLQARHANNPINVTAYSDSSFDNASLICSTFTITNIGTGQCRTAVMSTAKLWVEVQSQSTTSGGTGFDLSVLEAPIDEGSIATPIDLGSTLPISNISGQVGSNSATVAGDGSYYMVAVDTSTNYFISLNSSRKTPSLTVYTDSSFSTAVSCFYSGKACEWNSAENTNLYFKVSVANETGESYTISVNASSPLNEGSNNSPLQLSSPPLKNVMRQVARYTGIYNYYSVPVEPTTSYNVILDDFNGSMELVINPNDYNPLVNQSCGYYGSNLNSLTCSYLTGSTETSMQLRVRSGSSSIGTEFLISILKN